MSNEVTQVQSRSIVQDMANHYGMDKRAFEATLKATVLPANVSNEQFAAFLLVAKEYNLNPITKEIWAFPARGGGISPIVSVDGWANIINSHPAMDGIEYDDIFTDGQLTAIKCIIYRKDRSRPIAITEYMSECKGATDTWKRWPARMLRHKATIQCARMAFGFSGIYDQDEIDRMTDVTPVKPKSEALNQKYLGIVPENESQPPQSDNVPVIDIPSEEVGAAPQQEMPDMEELAEVNQAITELTNMPESTPEELKTKADTALTLIKTKVLTKLDAMHALNAAEFMQKLADNGLMMHRKKLSEA